MLFLHIPENLRNNVFFFFNISVLLQKKKNGPILALSWLNAATFAKYYLAIFHQHWNMWFFPIALQYWWEIFRQLKTNIFAIVLAIRFKNIQHKVNIYRILEFHCNYFKSKTNISEYLACHWKYFSVKPIFYYYWYYIWNGSVWYFGFLINMRNLTLKFYPSRETFTRFWSSLPLRHPVLRCLSQFRYNNNLTLPLILWCSKVQEHRGVRSANFKGRRLLKKFRATNLKKDVMKCEKWFGK